jgi:programmed cell death protein 4
MQEVTSLEMEDLGMGIQDANVNDRVIHKARRPSKMLPKATPALNGTMEDKPKGDTVLNNNGGSVTKVQKTDRKSRNGKGRGLPKKGGAGGKHTWGALGSELFAEVMASSQDDPNYDSDSQSPVVLQPVEVPPTTSIRVRRISDLNRILEPVICEYFEHGDSAEVFEDLEDLGDDWDKEFMIKMAVTYAMDRKASQRELTSRLISDLYGEHVLDQTEIAKGFDQILDQLNDLTLDTPESPDLLGQFIARAVADDCLPPKYLADHIGNLPEDGSAKHAEAALEKADILLNMKHGIVRLDNIWGAASTLRPVKFLVKKIQLLLKEYLSSGDIEEATRCLKELEVPHFHHEFVYEAIVMVLEESTKRAADTMAKLLESLTKTYVLSSDQLKLGAKRVFDNMGDIVLDVPNAFPLLEDFASICIEKRVFTEDLLKDMPERGRKRFVSEGDGGKIKDNHYIITEPILA